MTDRKGKVVFKLALSAMCAWMFYSVLSFIAQAVLVEVKPMQFEISLENELNSDFSVSYNLKQTQAGAVVYENPNATNDSTIIRTPYLKDNRITRLFLNVSGDEGSLRINSFSINNSYNNVLIRPKELVSYLTVSSYDHKSKENINLNGEVVEVKIGEGYQSLEFNSELIDLVYDRLLDPIFKFSLFISILVFFIFFALVVRRENFKVNGDLIFISFFLVIIFSPFFMHKHHKSSENRTLEPFPDLNVNIWRIPPRFDKYYKDHFPFKTELSQFNNYIKVQYLGISPSPENVRIGTDDWLFFSSRQIRTVFQGTELFSREELQLIKNNLETKAKLLKEKDIEFYLMVPPLKHTVYPEFLPKSLTVKETTKRAQLMKFLQKNSSLNIIDPLPTLVQAKDSIRVYYKNDTHWNQAGAFLVYQQLIRKISKKFPNVGMPRTKDLYNIKKSKDYEGDLIPLINLRGVFYREPYLFSFKDQSKAGSLQTLKPIGDEVNYIFYNGYEDQVANKPRLLMYRDSYSEYLYKHLGQHFSYAGFAWSRAITNERVDIAKPDILVYEVMERFVDDLKSQ